MSEIEKSTQDTSIPLLALRDVVVFPGMVIPLFVGREKSIQALEVAMEADKSIVLCSQKDASIEEPEIKDIHQTGVIANIMQLLKLPDGTVKVLVEGEKRIQVTEYVNQKDEFFRVNITAEAETGSDDSELSVLVKSLLKEFESYSKMSGKIAPEVMSTLNAIDSPSRLTDSVAANLELEIEHKQELLELNDVSERVNRS